MSREICASKVKPYIPSLVTSGLLPLMIASRAGDIGSALSVSVPSLSMDQAAALDRRQMYESAFDLGDKPARDMVKDVREYVCYLRDNHAHCGMHTRDQWKSMQRCMRAGSYCKKNYNKFALYALQQAVKSMLRDGSGLRTAEPAVVISGIDVVEMPAEISALQEDSSDDESTVASTQLWHELSFHDDDDDDDDDTASEYSSSDFETDSGSENGTAPVSSADGSGVANAISSALSDGDSDDAEEELVL